MSSAGLRVRFSLPSARPRGWEGAPRPLRPPPTTPARGKNNRSGAPSRLPSRREPNFLYLGPGGGLYAKGARPGSPSGPAGGGAQRLGPPRAPRALGCSPEARGQLGRAGAELCSCRRTTPRSRQPAAPPAAPGGPGGQAAECGVPPASQLSCAAPRRGCPFAFPVLRAGARAAIAAFSSPLQNEGKSRAGER